MASSEPSRVVRARPRIPHRVPPPAVDVERRYFLKTQIGEGTFGQVSRAIVVGTGKVVAIKRIKEWQDGLNPSALREISLLKELRHENIVLLEDCFLDSKRTLYLVFQYAEYDFASLNSFYYKNKQPPPDSLVKSLMFGLLNGLAYLHSLWVLHRDLKPANVLVGGLGTVDEGVVKITDFGLARIVQDLSQPLFDGASVVTIWYRAPELLLGSQHYTRAVDMWAVGCIFGELLISNALFRGTERQNNERWQDDQLMKITQVLGKPNPHADGWPDLAFMPFWPKLEQFPQPPECDLKTTILKCRSRVSDSCLDLLAKLLTYNPLHRITAAEALVHPYFSESPLPTKNCLIGLPDYPFLSLPCRRPD